ncbi:MAG: MetQ/NlpA family ABC transporter substrate-binding protein [Treponema sp.]|nr:MetQ/NlpA family ABC transporter substrate-binding protein [Treponema sp.]
MKKLTFLTLAIACSLLISCSKKVANEIKVGATPEPHAEILNLIVDDLAKEGFTLKVIEFTDYVTPNEALESGEIDANYFQHLPYLNSFNEERNYHLASVAGIHIEPLALYSNKFKSLDDVKDGATIAIPNDPTNEGRALLLLQSAGLITLEDKASLTAVPSDIATNPKNLKFREIEAPSLPRVLSDVDFAVINGNYAIPAGLLASRDGIIVEGADSPYVNVLCVKAGNENARGIKALVKALQSQEVKDYITTKYANGEVVAVF